MPRRGRRLVSGLIVSLACAAFGLAVAAPAGGAPFLRDFEKVLSQSPVTSDAVKTVRAGCPAGKMILSTGASAFPGAPITGTGLRAMLPPEQPPGTSPPALVSAVEANPVAASWGLLAERMCATPTLTPPTEATNASYLKDLFVAHTTSPNNSTSPKAMSTACQDGRQSIGGGFSLSPINVRKTAVRRAVRVEGGFAVEAHETIPHGTSWSVTAWALCANLGPAGARPATYASSFQPISAFAGLDINSPSRDVLARCPSKDIPVGGGAQVLGPKPTLPPPGDVVLTASHPVIYPDQRYGGFWRAAAVEESETPINWNLEVRAFCASRSIF